MVPFVLSISHHFVIDKSKKKKKTEFITHQVQWANLAAP